MSLLMEALRKAEAAKTKQEGKDADENKLSLEPVEETEQAPAPSPADDITDGPQATTLDELKTQESEAAEQEQDLEQFEFSSESSVNQTEELNPETVEEAEFAAPKTEPAEGDDPGTDYDNDEFESLDSSTAAPESTSELKLIDDDEIFDRINEDTGGADELYGYFPDDDNETVNNVNDLNQDDEIAFDESEPSEDYETLEAAADLSEYERSKTRGGHSSTDQAILDRQTANSLFQAKNSSQKSRRRQLALLALLVALLPLGGGFYWYYSTTAASNELFPGVAQNAQQGFIDDNPAPAPPAENTPPADVSIATDEPTEPPQLALEETGTEPEPTVPEASNESPDISAPDIDPASTTPQTPVTANPVVTAPALLETLSEDPVENQQAGTPEIQITRTTSRTEVNPDLMAAYESYQQNNLPQAQRLYTQVLNSQPNNRDALLGLAIINRQQGNIPEAQALYSRLLQLNPRDPLARAGLLQSAQTMSPSRQELELHALLEDYPDVAPLAFALGNLYASQSRWNEAQNAYFDALLIANENGNNLLSPDYAFNLAVSLEQLNQLDLAYDYYRQAQELSIAAPAGFSMDRLNQRLTYLREVLE